ncbi:MULTISPECIES: tripartite tricarboxylate transporter TctB family protein [unclassified Shinella]|jgi:putative tricarboxylic transport membrane protein|uniref:tripartite tricarboxylate transporter TctB family protein n=1 Tax=unclassified Shinella TaxID=2643062 RepID=UPI000681D66E|nr:MULTISPECIES: tripartite tricarboxylate transporter TctB family protein [unclassified Shinella]KNY13972.1 C4-dicarboxylate ABC transporter [Shinella sp. SUS2]KOC72720.1 C4-dicarboxylate ABC transporter [Shinella sp. GWS1]MCO5154617.1 tripartite tricarboxylate transporter TctB family protein [Shinella sp.]MDC7263889.1 tripartite tricarboxylate transporter TctB family protein [Shinella sp. HY16]MDC7270785.1 tripartite tricarboxylate transporter TctB family protein [Shinella sp. YZ44]
MSEVSSSNERRRPDRAALVIAPVLFVLAAVIWWDAGRLAEMSNYSRIGPATVPHVVAIGLALLAVWTGFEAWRGDFPEREPIEVKPVVLIVAGLAGQMLLLKTAGFSIATGVLFALTAFGFGRRKLWISLPIGIAFSFVVYIIFGRFLQLSLPAGPLEHLFF